MSQPGVQRRLAAILAADVAGYSRLMGEDEEGTLAALTAHRANLIDPAIAEHRGRIVKTTGDGLLAEFASVVDAVRSAAAIQTGMAGRNAGVAEDRRIEFRIGINLGDVIIQDDDVFGDGVNVAARLEALARPGGVVISGKVHDEVRGKLDLAFTDLGARTVKNIADPVRAFELAAPVASAGPGQKSTNRPAVAVPPFDNLSGDADQEYFADGLTEDIITALSRWRSFPVISRNSTFAYKGQSPDVREVAANLGARYVVEGSVRKGGQRVRINAQLIAAETGHHIWAERFDRDLDDMFALQDEITQRIAATVEPEFGRIEQLRSAAKHPASLNAWDCFQRGMYLIYHHTKAEIAASREMFQRALDLDPAYGQAHAGLAYSHQLDVLNSYSEDRDESIRLLVKHARQGVTLNDKDSFAHVMMGYAYRWAKQLDLAVAEAERAVELNPNDSWALTVLGNALDLVGKSSEGIACLERSLALNPRDVHVHFSMSVLVRAHLARHDHENAESWARKAIQRVPEDARGSHAYMMLASTLGHLDRLDEARDALDTSRRIYPRFEDNWRNWLEYRDAAANAHILDGLRKAGLTE